MVTIAPAPLDAALKQAPLVTKVIHPTPPKSYLFESMHEAKVWLKVLVYGKYGAGKTHFAGTAADVESLRDVLYIDFEGGNLTLANRAQHMIRFKAKNFAHLNLVKDVLVRHCELRDEGNEAALRALQDEHFGPGRAHLFHFNTVIIDSLSEAGKILMAQILGIDPTHSNLDAAVDNATFEHWGQASQRIQLVIRAFRAMPINVIFICSEKEKEDERKQVRIQPNLSGQLANDVQGFLDVVGYLATAPGPNDTIRRRLYLQPGAILGAAFNAKHRFAGQNVTFIDEPSVGHLVELLRLTQEGAH